MQSVLETLGRIARPAGLYVFYIACLLFTIGLMSGADIDATAIGAVLIPLGGVGGAYVVKRTTEKLEGKQ